MKKMKKAKIIFLILTVFMVSALILSCAGNGGSADNNPTASDANGGASGNTDVTSVQESTETTNSIEDKPAYDLPVKDLNGYNFRIMSRGEVVIHWGNFDISAEAENGDPINDAVYFRNKTIEEKYNVKITNIPESDADMNSKAAKSIKAGSDDYDLIAGGLSVTQATLIPQGLLMDLKTTPFVDLTKAWWDQKAVEQLSINQKLFATSCDLTIRDKDATIILMFNKNLLKDYSLEDPYQLVLSGKWTIDKMYDMIKSASKDLNGDGVIDDQDQLGLLTQLRHSEYFFSAAGEYISKANGDGMPEITLYSTRAVQVCDKIKEIMGDKTITLCADEYTSKYTDVWDGFQVPMFAENRALFYHAGMNRVTLLRTMETDFGILPPPKYDEQQANYHVAVDTWCTSSVSVPATVPNPETTGLLLEALVYESRYNLLPAYYDINLKTKFARDQESSLMINLILENRLYDLGGVYIWGGVNAFFMDMSAGKDVSLTTYWDKNSAKIESEMQKTLEKIGQLS